MKNLVVNNKKNQFSIYDIEIKEQLNVNIYNSTKNKYLKIILYDPKNVLFWRNIFEKSLAKEDFIFEPQIFESKKNCLIRFMRLMEIVEVPQIKVQARKFITNKKLINNYQIKTWFIEKDILSLLIHIELRGLKTLRILSWDIKYYFEEEHFPLRELEQFIWIDNKRNALIDKKENFENSTKKKLKTKIKSFKNSFTINKIIFGFQKKFIILIIN